MCHYFFLFFFTCDNCLLIVELWSIIPPHYVFNYVMSRARFLVNLTEFINVVSQLGPSCQQPFQYSFCLSIFQVTAVIPNKASIHNKVEIYSLVSTDNLWQEHNDKRKYWHHDKPGRDANRDSCVMDNFGHYRRFGQYSWQKSLNWIFPCGFYYWCTWMLISP